MARFSGYIGFVTEEETNPGDYSMVPVEHGYRGDLLKNAVQRVNAEESTNDDFSLSTKLSVVADAYLLERLFSIKYVRFRQPRIGGCWKVTNVEPVDRRIILTVGGVYNGPKASITDETGRDTGV